MTLNLATWLTLLRIALIRLKRHYDETYGKHGPLIG